MPPKSNRPLLDDDDLYHAAYSTAYALCPDSKQRAYLARRMSDCA